MVLPLLKFTLCHMDPAPLIYLLQLAVKTIRKSRSYVTWYRIRLSNQSLSIMSSFKVVNLMKNDVPLSQGVFSQSTDWPFEWTVLIWRIWYHNNIYPKQTNRKGRGIAVIYKSHLHVKKLSFKENTSFETLTVKLNSTTNHTNFQLLTEHDIQPDNLKQCWPPWGNSRPYHIFTQKLW